MKPSGCTATGIVIAPLTLGRTPAPDVQATVDSGPVPLLDRVFPLAQSDPAFGEALIERGWGAVPGRAHAL